MVVSSRAGTGYQGVLGMGRNRPNWMTPGGDHYPIERGKSAFRDEDRPALNEEQRDEAISWGEEHLTEDLLPVYLHCYVYGWSRQRYATTHGVSQYCTQRDIERIGALLAQELE